MERSSLIARRDILRVSLLALLPAGLFAVPARACTVGTPRLSVSRIAPDGTVEVAFEVANDSRRPASTRVQVYIHDQVASVIRPGLSLAAVKTVALQPGERRTIAIPLGPDAFRLPATAEQRIVEPGLFDIMVGTSTRDLQSVTLEIV